MKEASLKGIHFAWKSMINRIRHEDYTFTAD